MICATKMILELRIIFRWAAIVIFENDTRRKKISTLKKKKRKK